MEKHARQSVENKANTNVNLHPGKNLRHFCNRLMQERMKCKRVNPPYRPYSQGNPYQVIFRSLSVDSYLTENINYTVDGRYNFDYNLKMAFSHLSVSFPNFATCQVKTKPV